MTEPSTTIWSLVGQIATIMLCGGGIIMLEQIRQKALEWYRQRKLHPIARSVAANKEVNNLLIELRANTDADRAYIVLFHNGQVFSNKNPVWRLSCTQECCRSGTSHEIGNYQNILCPLFWDCLSPILGDDKECGPGISAHTEPRGRKMYRFDIHELNDGYYKRCMLARGVSSAYKTPIIDSKNDTVGYVALNYCGDSKVPDPAKIRTTLIEAAGNIHFALTN